MINRNVVVRKVFVYEREACDCCEGWYEERYQLEVDGNFIMITYDLVEILQWISDNTAVIDYEEDEYPEDD